MRVVSLLPAATDVVAALGALDRLVGVSHECDHPDAVRSRPRVTRSAVDAHAAPGEIDRQVSAVAAEGQPLFALDAETIRALRPDVLLTQDVCGVCAVSEGDVRALAATLDPAPTIVTLAGRSLDGVLTDVGRVAGALACADEAEEWLAGAMRRLRLVHETLQAARAPRPRVAVLEWGDPLYAAGHWVPEMVHRAGGVDVLAQAGAHSVRTTADAVAAADPEVLVYAPCGYGLPRAVAEGRRLLARPDFAWARDRRVWAIDANAYTSRPGPRLVDGIEALARVLHPSLFTPLDPAVATPLT